MVRGSRGALKPQEAMMKRQQPLDPALAESLAERRRRAGLTQNQIALATGIPEVTLHRYETARSPIPQERYLAIEGVLAEAEGLVPA